MYIQSEHRYNHQPNWFVKGALRINGRRPWKAPFLQERIKRYAN